VSRATYYAARGRTPRNCWTCDSPAVSKSVRRRLGPSVHLERDCSCSGATIRAAKRGARIQWQREAANDADEAAPFMCGLGLRSWFDYTDDDVWQEWADLLFGVVDDWMEWLRSRPVYPEPVLAVPIAEASGSGLPTGRREPSGRT
jgi:hypothetical protein